MQCTRPRATSAGAHTAARRALAHGGESHRGGTGPRTGSGTGGWRVLATLGEAERAREWIARGRLVDPDNVNLHINFACALARLGDYDGALDLIGSSHRPGSSEGSLIWLENDNDFDPLRGHDRFKAMIERTRARVAGEASRATAAGA